MIRGTCLVLIIPYSWLNVLFSIPLVLLVLSLVMFLTSFKQLKPTNRDNSVEEEIVEEESTQDLNV